MLITFFIVLVITILLNWYIMVFGKSDLQQLKTKLSIGTYLREIEESIDSSVGHNTTTVIKLGLILLSIVIVLCKAFVFLAALVAVLVGILVAKRSFKVSAVSNVLNKIATYINRIR